MKKTLFLFLFLSLTTKVWAQCGGQIMEPGFAFLSSSRGCAPFNVQIETLYLASTPGTQYFVSWGDGTPEEVYTQVNATGVIISHTYPNSPVDCGYDVTIDAENACNPRGSVVPIQTQVVVWTNDVISIDPGVYRVCQGFATDVLFTDNSDWNCYPRATRENGEARWIQWIYGTGVMANQIPGITVNSVAPGAYPYLDPAPGRNPIYPVLSPGQVSLPIQVPATLPADIGKEFEITLKNWNQCNPYDQLLTDGNPFNPVNGDLVNGDEAPQMTTARIVIVDAPQPTYVTRLGNNLGPIQTVFCVGDVIYFDNNTPAIAGASFGYRWEFFDNNTGAGAPIAVRTSTNPTYTYASTGQKLVRLRVRDNNAAGNCEAIYDAVITISPSLIAQIGVTDLSGNTIVPDFCQENTAPLTNFQARFNDVSTGTVLASTQWRWEFYNEANALVSEFPGGGAFSNTALGPFDRVFINPGVYRVRLRIRDNLTSCESNDEVQVRVFNKPQPDFSFDKVCQGNATSFSDLSTLTPIVGEQITSREWDMSYDGVTFAKDPTLDNQQNFTYTFPTAGSFQVALRVATDIGACSEIRVHTIVVDPIPNANFLPDRTSGCSTLRINFTNNSIAGQPDLIKEYRWEVDAGAGFQVDSIQRPSDPGFSNLFTRDFENTSSSNIDYQVRLRVITINDCEQVSAPATITVFPGPHSGFVSLNYSPFNNNCSPVSVDFTVDTQTQALNPSDYTWSISDVNGLIAQVSTGTTPAFTYNFANSTQLMKDFFVSLRASLPSGCYGDSTRMIRVSPVPSSAFDIDTLVDDCDRMRIVLEAMQKGLPEYAWTIDINSVVVLSSTTLGDTFEYEITRSTTTNQTVNITLVTTNFANCKSQSTQEAIIVTQTDNINAAFTASPAVQTLPNATVTLSVTNPGPWQYLWEFGDGTSSTNPAVGSHTYATYGTYNIKLTVSNGQCSESETTAVQINPIPPVLDFDYDPASGCVPLTVTFTNRSQYADPTSYQWSFGEGQGTSRAIHPTYTYYEPGIYSVTLSATNATGEVVQLTKPLIIRVFAKPNAQFSLKPKLVNIPGGKLFTDNQSFAASSYLWLFGDGETSTEFEPQHEYKEEGTFDVTLIASNAEGCADTTTLKAGVRAVKSGQLLIPNAFSPNLSGPGNGVGENDIFRPIMRGVSEYQMMVFNRWGQLLFETRNLEDGWDGYYQGKLCQQDVYVYKIVAKYGNGDQITRVGDIHLIR